MKKSKIKPEELLKDIENAISLISKVENINIEKDNLNEFKKQVEDLDKDLKEKYKNEIEEFEDDLDSEE